MDADFQANILVAGQIIPQRPGSLFLLISAAQRGPDESQTPVSSCHFPSVGLLHSPGLKSLSVYLIRGKSDCGRPVLRGRKSDCKGFSLLSARGRSSMPEVFTHLRANTSYWCSFRRWSNLGKSMSSMPSHAKTLMLCSI